MNTESTRPFPQPWTTWPKLGLEFGSIQKEVSPWEPSLNPRDRRGLIARLPRLVRTAGGALSDSGIHLDLT